MDVKNKVMFAQGNEAIAQGALAAGARFYAGYPITPSSEIAEAASKMLPKVEGVYVQMEDEIGSMAAIIGASAAGKKTFTATSGPGFSLMQENLGVAIVAEIPCVIINVQRSGPSTGVATKPAQGDAMQSRWGTHGDHGIIVISPSTVQECYDLTIKAFNLAEIYRTPTILLADEIIGHLKEKAVFRDLEPGEVVERKKPIVDVDQYKPFRADINDIPLLAQYGGDYILKISGSTHGEDGFPNGTPENTEKFVRYYTNKIEKNSKNIVMTKEYNMKDAEYAIITYGCSMRPALEAMEMERKRGRKVGILQLVTLWPFDEDRVKEILNNVQGVIVPELNLGQMIREIERINKAGTPIIGVNKVNGQSITPNEIVEKIEEVRI